MTEQRPSARNRVVLRTPEPELMDTAEQAEAYALADFEAPNRRFVELLLEKHPGFGRGTVIDLGCGPADIPLRLARRFPGLSIVAVDGARAMLEHAARAVTAERLDARIELVCATLPGTVRGRRFDAVLSNSLLHHLSEPLVLWREVKAVAKPGALVFVGDLRRPASEAAARALVELYSGNEPAILKTDFFNSLCAAFTPEEVYAQLEEAGLPELTVETISDRHLLVFGTVR